MNILPWHATATIRDEVRTGALRLAEFAADLNGARSGEGPLVYRDTSAFFARTFPSHNLKRIARDCLLRLSGHGGAPVIRLQVSYGGGKTHTLLTLLHLAERGSAHADLPTVQEFLAFAGLKEAPRARVAVLPFDKLDLHDGLVVYGPDGKSRRVRTPWGALAYQLGGDAAFSRVKAHEDGYDPPAEPLLVEILRGPEKEGLATLILLDEAVWYCRSAVNEDARRLGTLKDFFHSLIQAAGRADRCSFVAVLLASHDEARDVTGRDVMKVLEDEFGRAEETLEPVGKKDLAEVLRRRLFEGVPSEQARRPTVDALFARMQQLPLRPSQKEQAAYDRLLEAYPFHPDVLDVLYQKWTQEPVRLQRTRGLLRVLALATRAAVGSDAAPIVGPSALLGPKGELSEATLDLVQKVESEGDWHAILVGELEKAREIQSEFPTLRAREIEQAVLATFLCSQPRGQKAEPADLMALVAHPSVDVSALKEGLDKWRSRSWFLSEEPGVFRLGTQPNLTHMHVRAIERIASKPSLIDDELRARIKAARLGEADPDVIVHVLPKLPSDLEESASLRFAILPPECAAEPGKALPPNVAAFFDEKSGPSDPRTLRNTIVALAPDRAKLAGLRETVLRAIAYQALEKGDEAKLLTDVQRKELTQRRKKVEEGLPDQVRAAYSVLLAVGETGAVEAQLLPSGSGTAFERAKATLVQSERLLATTLDPELFLPESHLELWGTGERAKKLKDLLQAFAQFTRLPRLLAPRVLRDSIVRGVEEGRLVLQLARGDGSQRTLWRTPPSAEDLARPDAQVVPVAFAALHEIPGEVLLPGRAEGLWQSEAAPLGFQRIEAFFDGTAAPKPASPEVLDKAVREAVQRGLLMARIMGRTYLREALPDGPLPHDLELLVPPPAVKGSELGAKELPEAWKEGVTSVASIAKAIGARRGYDLPWVVLRDAVNEALSARLFEVVEQGTWPCGPDADRARVHLRLVEVVEIDPHDLVGSAMDPVWATSTTTIAKLKAALEKSKGRNLPDEALRKAVEAGLKSRLFTAASAVDKGLPSGKAFFDLKVKKPKALLTAEAVLDDDQIQDLADALVELKRSAPELDFIFRLTITAEGERPAEEALTKLNAVLGAVSERLRLEPS